MRSPEELRAHLIALVASHARAGYGRASLGALSVVDQGDGLAVVTVPWTVHTAANEVLWRFDVTYNLVRQDHAWLILGATTHGRSAATADAGCAQRALARPV